MKMIEDRKAMAGQGGFTLIELLVVIAILAVLAGAAIIGIGAMRTNAQKTACKSDMDTVEVAAEAYAIDENTDGFQTQQLLDSDYIKKGIEGADFTINWAGSDIASVTAVAGNKFNAATVAECNQA